MADDRIKEEQVERDLEMIGQLRGLAWQRSPQNLSALIERLQIKILVEDMTRRQRNVYRSIIDYFEDVLEERIEQDDDVDRTEVRRTATSYVRNILKSLDD